MVLILNSPLPWNGVNLAELLKNIFSIKWNNGLEIRACVSVAFFGEGFF